MRFVQITLLLAVLSVCSHAQTQSPLQREIQFRQLSGKTMKSFPIFRWDGEVGADKQHIVTKGHLMQLDGQALKQAYEENAAAITLQIPTGEKNTLNLKLARYDLFTDDFRVVSNGKEGEAVEYRPGRFYRGVVAGSSRSIAAVAIFEDKVMAVIETAEKGNMSLGALDGDPRGRYILYRTDDVAGPPVFECGAPGLEDATNSLGSLNEHLEAAPKARAGNCVRVYLECDYDMFREKGSVQNTVDYMAGLFNMVATIYQNEGVNAVVSEIFVWQSPDSYATTSTVDALKSFRLARSSFNGDLAHLVSRGAPAGGGVAWVDALCTSYSYAYSYIYSTYNELPAYSWSVNVITHEMGHNLGCWHTHDCSWDVDGDGTAAEAIDGCGEAAGYAGNGSCSTGPLPSNGGTIMSYCHLVGGVGINMNNGFGPLPGDKIRFEVGNASCLSTCSTCEQTVNVSTTPVDCPGASTGSATASASGGSTPYSYKWSNGATSAAITGVPAGAYSVSVTDATGCLAIESVTISQPPAIMLSIDVIPEATPGAGNGSIDLTPGGGTPPYTYEWSTGAQTQDLYGLEGGTYTVTLTDNKGCKRTALATVTSDGCDNLAGSFPYTEGFEANTGMWKQVTTDDFNWTRWSGPTPTNRTGPGGAAEGNYYLYIESSNYSGGLAILQSPCLDVSNLLNPRVTLSYSMYGSNIGELSVQASSDNGNNWTTLWMRSGSQDAGWQSTTVSLAGFGSTYTNVRIIGSAGGGQRGDIAIDGITVNGDPIPCNAPTLSVSSTPTSCFGGSDGTTTVYPSMGVSPYTYAWPNGAPTQTAVGLSAGSYEVTVTDNNGCSATATAIVGEPEEMVLSFDVTNVSASGADDGAIALSVTGGTSGYTYRWSTGAASQNISGLSQGTYTVTVTDAKGCNQTGSAMVTMPPSCGPIAALPYSESFEEGFGLWGPGDGDFNWERHSGGTQSNNTGPGGASDGMYYVFTESTSNNNSTAYLEGPCFDLSSAAMPVFGFDYHMFGNQMGTLRLEISTDAGATWETIWSRSGEQSRRWLKAHVGLNNYIGQAIRLRFSGTITGVRSDMAVDNIGLFDGAGAFARPVGSLREMQLSLQPNPANGWATAVIESPAEQDAELFLTSQLGQTRPLGTVSLGAGRNEIPLPVSEFNQGMYFLSVQTETGRLVERLLIQR